MATDTLTISQIAQGDTIDELVCVNEDHTLDITDSILKMQLYLGNVLIHTAETGNGITHVNAYSFNIDAIKQTKPFPVGLLKGDLQITNLSGDIDTMFNIEIQISKEYTIL